jgi:hypothetical protein
MMVQIDKGRSMPSRDDQTDTTQDGPPEPRSYELLATGSLARARKVLDLKNKSPEERASYHLAAAQTYAIMELAHAIRDARDA